MYKLYLVENTDPTGWGDFVKMVIKAQSLNNADQIVENYLLKYIPNLKYKITELSQGKIKTMDSVICEYWISE